MKKKFLLLTALVFVLVGVLAISASAAKITVVDGVDNITLGNCVIEGLDREIPNPSSGFTFELDTDTSTANITKWVDYADTQKGVVLCIPSTVTYNGTAYTVTSFNRLALGTDNGKGATNSGNFILVSIFIPDTVKSIPASAFEQCKAVEYVYIGNGLETWGAKAFYFTGTTVGSYYVDDGTGNPVVLETTGANMGDIKEFILKSKKVTELPQQIFEHTEFAKDAIIEVDITQFRVFGYHCIALNGFALTDAHYFKGTGIRFDVFDIRNATSIHDEAFYYAAGGNTIIINADQTKYFNANSLRGGGSAYYSENQNDAYFIICGGETPETAVTLNGPIWTANVYYWYQSTVFMNFYFMGYVNAYDGVDGLENQNGYGLDQVDYYFESKAALDHYIASLANTTSAATTFARYAKNSKGYFTVCDNTDGHKSIDYNLTYDSATGEATLVLRDKAIAPTTYNAGMNSATCTVDGGVWYSCNVCKKVASVEKTEDKLGHEFDISNGATVVDITYASFDKNGVKHIKCSRCEQVDTSTAVTPIFVVLGYSYRENSPRTGLVCGYKVNHDQLDEYVEVTGKQISFGVVMFNATTDEAQNAQSFFENGKLAINQKALSIDASASKYSTITIMMDGFNEQSYDLSLAIALYVNEALDGNVKTSFLQKTAMGDKDITTGSLTKQDGTLSTVSYNSITK